MCSGGSSSLIFSLRELRLPPPPLPLPPPPPPPLPLPLPLPLLVLLLPLHMGLSMIRNRWSSRVSLSCLYGCMCIKTGYFLLQDRLEQQWSWDEGCVHRCMYGRLRASSHELTDACMPVRLYACSHVFRCCDCQLQCSCLAKGWPGMLDERRFHSQDMDFFC